MIDFKSTETADGADDVADGLGSSTQNLPRIAQTQKRKCSQKCPAEGWVSGDLVYG